LTEGSGFTGKIWGSWM